MGVTGGAAFRLLLLDAHVSGLWACCGRGCGPGLMWVVVCSSSAVLPEVGDPLLLFWLSGSVFVSLIVFSPGVALRLPGTGNHFCDLICSSRVVGEGKALARVC
jgi:hypothetical protein